MQDLIKERRNESWRSDLRKTLSNKERIAIEPQEIPELRQAATIASLYIEDKCGFDDTTALTEAQRCLDCPNPGCVSACPAHIHIPSFIKNIERGNLSEAFTILRESSTLSNICSRVCPHDQQCEGGCIYHLGFKKPSVKIGALERYVSAWEEKNPIIQKPEASCGIRIAIVGSGPAGLAAAHDLSLLGYEVTVFEKLSVPGGVMRTGIPRFRLPVSAIEHEVSRLERYGVQFHYGVEIGRDFSIGDLYSQGYRAIFLGTGAGVSNMMGIPGEELKGVLRAGEYLYATNMLSPMDDKCQLEKLRAKRVAIIGGGNTAMDAARTARRLGAEHVTVIYRRGVEEMPACKDEIEHAIAEGIELMTLHQVKEYYGNEDGEVIEAELIEMCLTEPDESGRRRPEPTGRTKKLQIDQAIVCVGVSPEPHLIKTIDGLSTKWETVIAVNEDQESNIPMLYAGGDAARGGSTVVLAMRDGRRAAQAIHQRLSSMPE